jgi:hypothetical protein
MAEFGYRISPEKGCLQFVTRQLSLRKQGILDPSKEAGVDEQFLSLLCALVTDSLRDPEFYPGFAFRLLIREGRNASEAASLALFSIQLR